MVAGHSIAGPGIPGRDDVKGVPQPGVSDSTTSMNPLTTTDQPE
jgi:hypothetical protein